MKKESRVQWRVSGEYDCPHCGHSHDFMNIDEYWSYSKVAENTEKFYNPIEVSCEKCNGEFLINGSDY